MRRRNDEKMFREHIVTLWIITHNFALTGWSLFPTTKKLMNSSILIKWRSVLQSDCYYQWDLLQCLLTAIITIKIKCKLTQKNVASNCSIDINNINNINTMNFEDEWMKTTGIVKQKTLYDRENNRIQNIPRNSVLLYGCNYPGNSTLNAISEVYDITVVSANNNTIYIPGTCL